VVKDKHLFGTITKSSVYNVVEEIKCPMTSKTCFVDLGSGLGHLCFYMKVKYPEIACLGIEINDAFFAESIRRKNELFLDVKFMKEDLFRLEGTNFSEYENYIFFTFDTLFPEELLAHIRDKIVLTCPKSAAWINFTENGSKLETFCYSGVPGIDENTKGVLFNLWSKEKEIITEKSGENELVNLVDHFPQEKLKKLQPQFLARAKKIVKDKEGNYVVLKVEIWRAHALPGFSDQPPPQLTKHYSYVLKNQYCINCEVRMAGYICSCCGFRFCGRDCQRITHTTK
jgi:hypothetical protein